MKKWYCKPLTILLWPSYCNSLGPMCCCATKAFFLIKSGIWGGRGKEEGRSQFAILHCAMLTSLWLSSSLFQLQCNVNIQYLLIGYSWDLINHSDGCFYTVSRLTDYRAAGSSHTGYESLWLSRKLTPITIIMQCACLLMNDVLIEPFIERLWHAFSSNKNKDKDKLTSCEFVMTSWV